MSPRVLYITLWPPQRSGIADYAWSFARALERYGGCEMTVLPSAGREDEKSFRLRDFLTLRRQALDWSRDGTLGRYDLAHVELGSFTHRELVFARYLKDGLPRLPLCATVHDPPRLVAETFKFLAPWASTTPVRGGLELIDRTIGRAWQSSFIRRVDRVFVLSRRGSTALRARYGTEATVLPFLSSNETAPPRIAKDPAMPVVILFFGFVSPSKGLDVLLRAFALLQARLRQDADSPSVELWINHTLEPERLNGGYIRGLARLAEEVGPAVKRLGFVPEEEIAAVFAQADIMVLPHKPYVRRDRLSSSSSLIRGMLHGLAIVGSRFQVVDEEIQDGVSGLLVEPDNIVQLADRLHGLVKDPLLRRRLGAAAREHVLAEHNWPAVARRVRAGYDGLSVC